MSWRPLFGKRKCVLGSCVCPFTNWYHVRKKKIEIKETVVFDLVGCLPFAFHSLIFIEYYIQQTTKNHAIQIDLQLKRMRKI